MNPVHRRLKSLAILIAAGLINFSPLAWGAEPVHLRKKEIPEITFKNLSPPYRDYQYFQNRKAVPFEYKASSFSLLNAWWLAEASTLVYADEAFVKRRFSAAGLRQFKFFNRHGTQCFIASNGEFAIVAFRGSEGWKLNERFDLLQVVSDWMTDFDIRLAAWTRGGRVHRGFRDALEDVWADIFPYMEKLADQGCRIWLTGHSLGAALATLAADRFQDVQGLYTFGSPRVGDRQFQENFRLRAYRVVNGDDIVARVPPKGPYRHVGALKFIDHQGRIHDGRAATEAADPPCRDAPDVCGDLKETKPSGSAKLIPDAIRDHVPLLYAIFLWNRLVQKNAAVHHLD
jgi:pimeloyl-ACP methyl ester carboxylesterase